MAIIFCPMCTLTSSVFHFSFTYYHVLLKNHFFLSAPKAGITLAREDESPTLARLARPGAPTPPPWSHLDLRCWMPCNASFTCRQKIHILKKAHSKKSIFKRGHIPKRKRAHFEFMIFYFFQIPKRAIPNRAHSKKGTFQKEHIPKIPKRAHSKKAHSKKKKIPKKAHSKKNTFQNGHIPKKVHSNNCTSKRSHSISLTFLKGYFPFCSDSILSIFQKGHIPFWSIFILITLQKRHISKRVHSKKCSFQSVIFKDLLDSVYNGSAV